MALHVAIIIIVTVPHISLLKKGARVAPLGVLVVMFIFDTLN